MVHVFGGTGSWICWGDGCRRAKVAQFVVELEPVIGDILSP